MRMDKLDDLLLTYIPRDHERKEVCLAILSLFEEKLPTEEELIREIIPMLDLNIHGHINHPNPAKRKPVVSRVGKECAEKIGRAMLKYLLTDIRSRIKGMKEGRE
jgi:hypothetical protein